MCFLYHHSSMHARSFDRMSELNSFYALAFCQGIYGRKTAQAGDILAALQIWLWAGLPDHGPFRLTIKRRAGSALAPCQVQEGDGASRVSVPVRLLPHKPRHTAGPNGKYVAYLTNLPSPEERWGQRGVDRQVWNSHSLRWGKKKKQEPTSVARKYSCCSCLYSYFIFLYISYSYFTFMLQWRRVHISILTSFWFWVACTHPVVFN